MLGLKGMAMMGVLMLAMAGAFAWYYKDSQSRIATLTENNAKLEIAVQTNEETINVLQQDFAFENKIENCQTDWLNMTWVYWATKNLHWSNALLTGQAIK